MTAAHGDCNGGVCLAALERYAEVDNIYLTGCSFLSTFEYGLLISSALAMFGM